MVPVLSRSSTMLCLVALAIVAASARADETPLQPGQFPPQNAGTYLSGELIIVDPVNRRAGLRLDGDTDGRYHAGPLHYIAMLPFGIVRYHGAPAELRDIPIGTHVHGYFLVPPKGEEQTIPPLPPDQKQFTLKFNHAISLEDDFSFYQGRGQSWKVASVDLVKGKINVEPAIGDGAKLKDGIVGPYTFDIDTVTRVWKSRQLVELSDITPGTTVQLNLTWSQGSRDKEFTVSDIWLNEEAWKFATEEQRRRHVRFQKQRWLPGWIDHVEHNDYGGGIVTLTLFGGMDQSLYAELKATQEKGFGVAAAEKTLRTWFHRADKKIGQVVQWQENQDPPPGSSGIQIKLKFTELLEGYRPGKCVRVKCHDWIFVTMPPEERVKSLEDQQRSATLIFP